ncbi:unnamed protein product [Mycena citricolor]|uniref:LsmAD domain-containing protein n=1 Tax=Mycena citricolor TaxID=2018698 RepID=A0AAD2JY85_9AGAR|nr:unnamed protein product [Mycena citricolor]
MASSTRPPKQQRKPAPEPARARQPAWTGARASPTYSPSSTPHPTQTPAPSFPPLAAPTAPPVSMDRVLQSLAGLTGTTITLLTKTSSRFEGVIGSTSSEGDTTGVTLRDVKDLTNPGGPLKESLFIASTNIDTWSSGPADAKVPNGDSFRTDVDITNLQKKALPRERELQAWQPDSATNPASSSTLGTSSTADEETFGTGATGKNAWDQFNANERLFGVKTTFDEEAYTTKLDRNAPDYKERERKAQKIANEIMGATSNNPHVAEERSMNNVDDSGENEEDKYGAVVRAPGAYVPPGARPLGKVDGVIPRVAVNGPDGLTNSPSPAPSGTSGTPAAVTAFSDFVTSEKNRLQQKRQAMVKSDMDKRLSELVSFGKNFKLNKPIPEDLVPILAKDEEKQRAIKEKATRDATSAGARNIGASSSPTTAPGAPRGGPALAAKISSSKVSPPIAAPLGVKSAAAKLPIAANGVSKPAAAATPVKAPKMVIQSIPPFRGAKTRQSSQPQAVPPAKIPSMTASATTSALPPASPSPVNANALGKLSANAPSFKPNPKAGTFSPVGPPSASGSPKPKAEQPATPNAFFGTRVLKKTATHIKDDFNPFKLNNKVVEASQIAAMWPYNGKRYMLMFPQSPAPPPHAPHPSPHMQPPGPMPMPPQAGYDDEAAARGYVYAYPPYGYPGQMLPPGMVPPGPPGAYMGAPYMQAMPYPPGMPPPAMYASAQMGQMPPPQAYMQPPPGAYPPPNGAAHRPSMPPTPIPAHAHPYYHQSPQPHAVPYQMMMQQPTGHPYDGSQVPMGGGGHA